MNNAGLAASVGILVVVAVLNVWSIWMLLKCNARLSDKAKAATGSPYSAIGYQVR
jgi:amino acid permease